MSTVEPPAGVKISYRQQYRRCGKPGCPTCSGGPGHGPYWYASWWIDGRSRSRYIGKELPAGSIVAPAAARIDPPAVPAPVPSVAQELALPALRVRTLGGFAVWRGDQLLSPEIWTRRKKAAILFKCLLTAPGYRIHRDQLIDLLWPETEDTTNTVNLRYTVHLLRRMLDRPHPTEHAGAATEVAPVEEPGATAQRGYIRTEGELVALVPAPDAEPPPDWLDAATFARAATAALVGRDLPACHAALALYTGDYLPDEVYEEWAAARRDPLRQQWLALLLHQASLAAARGDDEEAATALQRVLTADPAHEAAARSLLRLQALAGRRTEAIRTYRRLAEALRRDLDVAPELETQALYRALLDGTLERAPAPAAAAARPTPVQPALDAFAGERTGAEQERALVGRARELEQLRVALAQAGSGHGGLLILDGPAGMGKSRLLAEFLRMARRHGALVLSGRAYRQEGQLPYGPLQDALRGYVQAQPAALLQAQMPFHAVLVRLIPELATLLTGLPAAAALEPRAERHRLFAALGGLLVDIGRRLAEAHGAGSPVVLALEDLHWADVTTIQALHYLERTGRDAPLLIVGTCRTDELGPESPLAGLVAELQGGSSPQVLRLGALGQEEVAALLETLLAPQPVAVEVVELVATQSRGNPLFAGELVAAMREAGRIALRDGSWRIHLDGRLGRRGMAPPMLGATLPVPARIQALIRERLGRLDTLSRRLLPLCAVLGQHQAYEVLCAASDLSEEEILDALEVLLAAAVLEETVLQPAPSGGSAARGAGHPGYLFHHPLIQEAVYQSTPVARRTLLHRRAGEALERFLGAEAPARAVDLAWHFGQAGHHARAAYYAQVAGDQAARAYAGPEAVAHYLEARAHIEHLSAGDGAHDEERSRLDEKLGDVRLLLGEFATAREDFARARDGEASSTRRAELWRKEGASWERRGEFDRALAALDAAAAEGEHTAAGGELPPALLATLAVSRAAIQFARGEYESATAAATGALDSLGEQRHGAVARAFQILGNVATEQGDLDRAEACYRRSLAVWEQLDDQQGIASVWNGMGLVAAERGETARAEEYHRRSLAIRERIGNPFGVGASWNNLGNLAYDRGEYAEAAACYQRSLAIWEQIGDLNAAGGCWNNLGGLAMAQGDLQQAESCRRRSLAIWEQIGNRTGVGVCWQNLGNAAQARGDLAQAEECYLRGLAILEQTSMHEPIAACWTGLGEVAGERGDIRGATSLFRRARRLGRQRGLRRAEASASLAGARVYLRVAPARRSYLRAASAMLAHARALAHDLAEITVQALLLDAELRLRQGGAEAARPVAAAALELAIGRQARLEQGLAHRLLGRCSLIEGDRAGAAAELQAALALQTACGASLEAARTERILTGVSAVR